MDQKIMPFPKLTDLPANIQKLPVKAQEVFQKSFNSAFNQSNDEKSAFSTANAAVKKAGFEFAESTTEWMALIKTGTHTASSGKKVTITKPDLDNIVRKYSVSDHEAPIVIGHPKMDSPAWGWIGDLKRDGNMLFGKPDKMVPEFVEWSKKGLYKKRSISLYPDMTLKHVGFLGGAPPAVKGLPDFCFKEEPGESITFEFGEKHFVVKEIFSRMRDWLIEREGAEKANKIINAFDLDFLGMPEDDKKEQPIVNNLFTEFPNNPKIKETKMSAWDAIFKKKVKEAIDETPPGDLPAMFSEAPPTKKVDEALTFSEADIKTAEKKASDKAKEEVRLEFAEKERKLSEDARRAKITEFCEKQSKAGKMIPAWKKAGIEEFMLSLVDDATEIEFAEKEESKTRLDWFLNFMEGIPKVISFDHIAKGKSPADQDANTKLVNFAEAEIEKNKDLSFSEAMTKVSYMHPELVELAADEQGVTIN